MSEQRFLNLGCGDKVRPEWENVDMIAADPRVRRHNFLDGIPFPNDWFDTVYHSQVLEHIPRDRAAFFMSECLRVLKPHGFVRVVVPDLENIAREYLRLLDGCLTDPDEMTEANYDWIMMEMYDQTVRNQRGGDMGAYLARPSLINEEYILNRIGHVGRTYRCGGTEAPRGVFDHSLIEILQKLPGFLWRKLKRLFSTRASRIGAMRLSGEIHMWMYDRFSLARLLRQTGFVKIEVKSPFESAIPNWAAYELDVKDGLAYDPTSLFVEARKPSKLDDQNETADPEGPESDGAASSTLSDKE